MQGESTSDCKALTALLSPQGRLVPALHSADADALIMFKFPPERLPSHTQMLLGNDLGRHAPLPGPGLPCRPPQALIISGDSRLPSVLRILTKARLCMKPALCLHAPTEPAVA